MANLIQQCKDWLSRQRVFQVLGPGGADSAEPDDSRAESSPEQIELPPKLAQQLTRLVDQLPIHPDDRATVQSSLESVLAEWQQQPGISSNSLVILSSPVTAVSRILSEGLAEWAAAQSWSLSHLEWQERPAQPEEIVDKLRLQLGRGTLTTAVEPEITAIPNLSWCFLRSAEGLDGIDYLRDHLLNDRTRFWVIGSDPVSWEYLKSVLDLPAYCGQVVSLPELSGEQLAAWIMPVAEALEIHFDSPSIRDRLQHLNHNHSEQSDSPQRFKDEYFERLADVSEGISTVALQLFLRSVEAEPLEAEDAQDANEDNGNAEASETTQETQNNPDSEKKETPRSLRLVARSPKLPSLPQLNQNDHYLLYSLLLHGDLTLTALAESLGDAPQTVNNQVQALRRTGLLKQQDQVIQVNPIHYPRLQQELAANNFLVERSE